MVVSGVEAVAHVYTSAGSYDVIAMGTSNCNADTLEFTVNVEDCADGSSTCTLEVPNIFTPNGDGRNDALSFASTCAFASYELHIYNRWGALVFNSTSASKTWNGKSDGEPCSEGVYFYILNYRYPGDKPRQATGSVTLTR